MTSPANKVQILLAFWKRLTRVTQLTYQAQTKSKEETGWSGKGQGEVIVTKDVKNTLIFRERGIWQGKQGIELSFSNTYRWTLDTNTSLISLEHLRHGSERPVFLFHLTLNSKHSLISVDPHLCGRDNYLGQIYFDSHIIRFNWRIMGPKKNEEINYYYS